MLKDSIDTFSGIYHSVHCIDQRELLNALRRGVFTSAILVAIASFFVVKWNLGMEHIGVFYAIITGLIVGVVIGLSTEFFTSDRYRPAREVADNELCR